MNKSIKKILKIKRYSDPLKEKKRLFKANHRFFNHEKNPYTAISDLATKRMKEKL